MINRWQNMLRQKMILFFLNKTSVSLFYRACRVSTLAVICIFWGGQYGAAATAKKNIFILHSYHQEFPWTDSIMQGIKTVFNDTDTPVELYVEYMDLKRHPAKELFPYLKALYKLKYQHIDFDAIILSDDFALSFVLGNRNSFFKDIPVVFCGINNFSHDKISGHNKLTGIAEDIDIQGTIALALSLHPNIKNIAAINDGAPPGIDQMNRVRKAMKKFRDLRLIELFDLSVPELKQRLAKLPHDTVVLHIHYYTDKATGKSLTIDQSFEITRQHTRLPIYTGWDFQIGFGATGGLVTNGHIQGKMAAQMALRVLNGEPADNIPAIADSPNTPMFDYNYLGQYGVSMADLPGNSIVMNQPRSIYREYKLIINLVIFFILILIVTNICLFLNIRKQKRLEKNLEATKKQFKDMVENTSDWIWETDAEGYYTYASPRIETILGHTPESLIGKTPFDLMPQPDRDRLRSEFQKIAAKKKSFHGLLNENLHTDGSERILETSGVPILNQDGELTGFRGVDRDVTESHHLRKKIEHSEATLQSILKASPIGIGMMMDQVVTFVNDGFCDMTEYSRDELLAINFRNLYPSEEEFQRVDKEKYNQISQQGTGTVETQLQTKSGKIIDVLLSSTPLDSEDLSKGITFAAIDITERKKNETELREYRHHLEDMVEKRTTALDAKNKELETFTYSVSHDLKAPLRGIDGYSRLLEEEYSDRLDEDGLFFLNNIRQGTAQMNKLIEDLLAYSRMERKNLYLTAIDLNSLIENLVDQRTHDIEQCRITITVDLPFNTIESDTETLRQVLTNYLDNAIKYSKKDTTGTVTIGGSQDDHYWTLWVKDTGIGFDPRYLDRIFDILKVG